MSLQQVVFKQLVSFLFLMFTFTGIHAVPLNIVEQHYVQLSGFTSQADNENFSIVETANVLDLGKLTSLTFILWVQQNPQGVIALPTGKTPEYFIKFLNYYKKNWTSAKVQEELKLVGLAGKHFPDTSNLKFVQLDEFVPIEPTHVNSFTHFVKKYYLGPLGIKPENSLHIDLSFIDFNDVDIKKIAAQDKTNYTAKEKQVAKQLADYIEAYEAKINAWGGIGLFLGGIGYDGHVAFIQPNEKLNRKMQLVNLNYPTRAQSAGDLGGIHNVNRIAALTIGLDTILKPHTQIILFAAGEAKAPIIAKGVEQTPSDAIPFSLLSRSKYARLYLTKGAASQLSTRKVVAVKEQHNSFDEAVIQIALQQNTPIMELTESQLAQDKLGKLFLQRFKQQYKQALANIHQRIVNKIETGLKPIRNQVFMHTAPHHDDIMLSYYGIVDDLLGKNTNYFSYFTSGYTAVTDDFVKEALAKSKQVLAQQDFATLLDYHALLSRFYQKYQVGQSTADIEAQIAAHKLIRVLGMKNKADVLAKIDWYLSEYYPAKIAGEHDIDEILKFKGAMRETEVDKLWSLSQVDRASIKHLRSKFYSQNLFKALPNIEQDAKPFIKHLQQTNPDIISLAFDPEGTGPDTHYKVLQLIAESLRLTPLREPKIWGYRNVWHKFPISDANLFFPVSKENLNAQHQAFMHCFSTQRSAAFPSPFFDGPFSALSVKVQQEQLANLKTVLGAAYFEKHHNPAVRNAAGYIFIKEMRLSEFLNNAKSLQAQNELEESFSA